LIKVADIKSEWSENNDYFIGAEVEILMGYEGNYESIISGEVTGVNSHIKLNKAKKVIISGFFHQKRYKLKRFLLILTMFLRMKYKKNYHDI
jgi:hypothetical protein